MLRTSLNFIGASVIRRDKGDQGPKGDKGAPGDCCCKDSVKYAISLIYKQTGISLVSFNTTIKGTVAAGYDPTAGSDLVNVVGKAGNSQTENTYTVSLCNVKFMTYPNEITFGEGYEPIVDTPECCCNTELAEVLKNLIGDGIPDQKILEVDVVDNTASSYRIKSVSAISNGVLFGEFTNTVEENSYGAIPLCSIFAFTLN